MRNTQLRWKAFRIFMSGVAATILASSAAKAQTSAENVTHPLDPLTASEYESVIDLLRKERLADEFSLYPLITLEEPAKSAVLSWQAGDAIPRFASVVVKNGAESYEGILDIRRRNVESWSRIEGEPGVLLSEEWTGAGRQVRANAEWREAVRKRGIDPGHVVCIPFSVSADSVGQGRRLAKVISFYARDTHNFWGRPIEGLIAVVDQNAHEVVEIIDTGVVPIPSGSVDFDTASVGQLRQPANRLSIVQQEGASYKVEGHVVGWQKWRFHWRIDPRLGLVVSRVLYEDGGRLRSILYQGSLSELFVPYMDPDEAWYFRAYLDAGEYGVGKLAAPLQPGADCPENARFFEAVFCDDWGEPYTIERVVCLFERSVGDAAWRHYESVHGKSEVRRRTELVLRFVAAIGNYDYVFDWIFREDGTIRVAVTSSGVVQVKAVTSRTVADDAAEEDLEYGHLVAAHTVATNHDHFLCFRLDLDVDGSVNGFVAERLRNQRLRGRRTSVWVVNQNTPATELAARMRIDLERPTIWRVVNRSVLGALGYPVGYQLKPGTNAVSLLSADDLPQRRAGFSDFHLWVTPFEQQQRYAAGKYPNHGTGGDGLPAWTSADRPIQERDVVLWYTLGFHHVVRTEDWPVMPSVTHDFELRPFDFFDRNPALDLPD